MKECTNMQMEIGIGSDIGRSECSVACRGGVCPPFSTGCYIIVAKGGQTPPLQSLSFGFTFFYIRLRSLSLNKNGFPFTDVAFFFVEGGTDFN